MQKVCATSYSDKSQNALTMAKTLCDSLDLRGRILEPTQLKRYCGW